jgi:hypothetical protein
MPEPVARRKQTRSENTMTRSRQLSVIAVTLIATASIANASTVVLKNGGRIAGEITAREDQEPKSITVRTAAGSTITVAADQIREILDPKNALPQYEELLPRMPASADGNWKMAKWCAERSLTLEQRHHLRKVIELEPDHAEARAALGYKKDAKGQWENSDEKWLAFGYQKVGSRYKTQQEIAIDQDLARYEVAYESLKDAILKDHRKALKPKDSEQALSRLRALEDPMAIDILVREYLTPARGNTAKNNQPTPELKKVYIGVVGKKPTYSAVQALVHITLYDPQPDVRDYTLQQLVDAKHPATTGAFLSEMSAGISKGDDAGRDVVNRAAYALGRLNAEQAVFPLIAALQTKTRTRVGGGGAGGGIGATPIFGDNGAAGLSAGGKEKIIENTHNNPGVLDALRSITKQDFEYNQVAWKQWYIDQKTPKARSMRRD